MLLRGPPSSRHSLCQPSSPILSYPAGRSLNVVRYGAYEDQSRRQFRDGVSDLGVLTGCQLREKDEIGISGVQRTWKGIGSHSLLTTQCVMQLCRGGMYGVYVDYVWRTYNVGDVCDVNNMSVCVW